MAEVCSEENKILGITTSEKLFSRVEISSQSKSLQADHPQNDCSNEYTSAEWSALSKR